MFPTLVLHPMERLKTMPIEFYNFCLIGAAKNRGKTYVLNVVRKARGRKVWEIYTTSGRPSSG